MNIPTQGKPMNSQPSRAAYRLAKWGTVVVVFVALFFGLSLLGGFDATDLLPTGLALVVVALLVTRIKRHQESRGWLLVRGIAAGVAIGLISYGLVMVGLLVLFMMAWSNGGFGSSK
jgi:hypothetical protein